MAQIEGFGEERVSISFGGRKLLEIADFGSIIGDLTREWSQDMAKSKDVIRQSRKAACRKFSAGEKIRIVLVFCPSQTIKTGHFYSNIADKLAFLQSTAVCSPLVTIFMRLLIVANERKWTYETHGWLD